MRVAAATHSQQRFACGGVANWCGQVLSVFQLKQTSLLCFSFSHPPIPSFFILGGGLEFSNVCGTSMPIQELNRQLSDRNRADPIGLSWTTQLSKLVLKPTQNSHNVRVYLCLSGCQEDRQRTFNVMLINLDLLLLLSTLTGSW